MYYNYFDTITLVEIDKVDKLVSSSIVKDDIGTSGFLAILTKETGETVDMFQTFDTQSFLEELFDLGYKCGLIQEIGSKEATFEVESEDGSKKVTCSVLAPVGDGEFEDIVFNPNNSTLTFLRKIDESAYEAADIDHFDGWDVDHDEKWFYPASDNVPASSNNHVKVFLRAAHEFFRYV